MAGPLLLDTCACLWAVEEAPMEISAVRWMNAAAASGELFVSPFTAWEVAKLFSLGRVGVGGDPHLWLSRLMARPGVRLAPLDAGVLIESNLLPGVVHRDPADRILIATARKLGCPLVTRDRPIIAYAEAGHLDVLVC